MKHAGRDFWPNKVLRTLLARITGLLLWAASASALALPASHIVSAQMLVTPGGSFDMPPLLAFMPSGITQTVTLPHVFPRARGVSPDAKGKEILTAWYEIPVPATLQQATGQPLRLYLPRWQTIGQIAVYSDGRLVFRSGAGPVWNGFNHPLWVTLGGAAGDKPPSNLLIRVDHFRSAGLALSTVWLGDQSELSGRYGWREFLQSSLPATLAAAFLLIGFFSLAIWVLRREAMYGLFFLTSLFGFIRSLHFRLGLEPLPIPEVWFGWLTVNSLLWVMVAAHLFGYSLQAARYPRVERVLIGLTVAVAAISLPGLEVLPFMWFVAPLLYVCVAVLIVFMTLVGVRTAWRTRSAEAMLVVAWSILVIPTGFHDLMLQTYRIDIERLYLLPYAMLGFFPILLYAVLKRYVGALQKVAQANTELQSSLKAKELELGDSYARLRIVENEQTLSTERQRLMQDMHDGLGSSLMGALKAVESGRVLDLGEVLRECIDDLKLAIDSLEPIQADLLLLLATLRFRLGVRLEQAGVQLNWQVEDVPAIEWLDPHSALQILRIVQEILANAVKHARADTVTLTTTTQGDQVLVVIEDNGIGFDASQSRVQGRGLNNVQRRAHTIGAKASWAAQPAGTRFELALPLQAPQAV